MVKQLFEGNGETLEDATKDLFVKVGSDDSKVKLSYKVTIKGFTSEASEHYGVAFADALRKADIEPQRYSQSQYDTTVAISGTFETKKQGSPSGSIKSEPCKRDMTDLF